MNRREIVALALAACLGTAATASAQPMNREADMESRVLDILFPKEVSKPYAWKMVLRYWDDDTQLMVVLYPGPPGPTGELIRYSLSGTSSSEYSQLIFRMLAENPGVKAEEIAAKLKIHVVRSPIEYDALRRALKGLKAVRVSPVLAGRVAVDESSVVEFWYDTGQEGVHYVIRTPFLDEPQDQLGKWMMKFRASLADLQKAR